MGNLIKFKLGEAFRSVLPIALIVFLLAVTLTPMETGTFLLFLFGVAFLVLGLALFTLGAEMSMQPLGSKIGASLTGSGKLWLITFVSFVIGILVTISEPDLQILARQVSKAGIPNLVLILTVSVGVGIFLVIAMLRAFFHIPLSALLAGCYGIAFLLCFFVPKEFWSLAFDSGGVTTGPMTVPFIMAIGAGVSTFGSQKNRHDDSFGLVALCSIGPVLSVLILGIIFRLNGTEYIMDPIVHISNTREGLFHFANGLQEYAREVGIALAPILAFALLFQLISRAFTFKKMVQLGAGLLYTFAGLVLFLCGANGGLMPIGDAIGTALAGWKGGYVLIPVSMLIGYFIVNAEPAVYVLNKQVEKVTAGAVSARTMRLTLSIGVSVALGLSVLRIVTGISVLWILIPGYLIALLLSLMVPPFFTGIAFDSGGVASGVMMSAFVLPLSIGACAVLDPGGIMTQAYGCVSFVALTPVISIQVCGLVYRLKAKRAVTRFTSETETFLDYSDTLFDRIAEEAETTQQPNQTERRTGTDG